MTIPALNPARHKTVLLQILKDIYSDASIASALGFKGGTAAFLFYGLDRFSVDIDLDLLDGSKEAVVFKRVEQIASQYGTIREVSRKRYTLLIVLSYESRATQVKIEINRRAFGSRYQILTYLGISMQVMVPEDAFAHKLMAMHERIGKTSRDIYDVWFFLRHTWDINREMVEQRAGLPFTNLVQRCIRQLETVADRSILKGLGELLTPGQKIWAKKNLRGDTIFLLKALADEQA
jgi:predicted nucleotidyltransferase component of viral defense system